MTNKKIEKKFFTAQDIGSLRPNEKIALIATLNEKDLPHISFISSLLALDETHMAAGEFTRGISKKHIKTNHKIGFCILTLSLDMWRGKAEYTHSEKEGPVYSRFNEIPMFRYNTYFGINTVHFFDLVSTLGREKLPFLKIGMGMVSTMLTKWNFRGKHSVKPLNSLALNIINRIGSLKFLSWKGRDDFPVIFPVLQTWASDPKTIVFSCSAFGEELKTLKPGIDVAVFALTLKMENVLMRTVFKGFKRICGINMGVCE